MTLPLLLALHDGGMGHDRLEAAMFWVGALLAGLPVLVLGGVFFYIRWQKKKAAEGSHPVDPA